MATILDSVVQSISINRKSCWLALFYKDWIFFFVKRVSPSLEQDHLDFERILIELLRDWNPSQKCWIELQVRVGNLPSPEKIASHQ